MVIRIDGLAISEFGKCITIDPDFAKPYYHRAVCRFRINDQNGVNDLNMAIKCDNRYFEAYLARASYNQSRGTLIIYIRNVSSWCTRLS